MTTPPTDREAALLQYAPEARALSNQALALAHAWEAFEEECLRADPRLGPGTRLFFAYSHPEHGAMGVSVDVVRDMFESIRAGAVAMIERQDH